MTTITLVKLPDGSLRGMSESDQVAKNLLNQDELKDQLKYDPDSGIFMRIKVNPQSRLKVGDVAGSLTGEGYLCIMVNRKLYQAHRLAWLYMTGNWPKNQIDHVNEIKTDNRFINLREATNLQNRQNIFMPQINNKTGYRGVSFEKESGKYKAQIRVNNKKINLGRFDMAEEAYQAYLIGKAKYHTFAVGNKNA